MSDVFGGKAPTIIYKDDKRYWWWLPIFVAVSPIIGVYLAYEFNQ